MSRCFGPKHGWPASIEILNKGLKRLLKEHSIEEISPRINKSVKWIKAHLEFEPKRLEWYEPHNYHWIDLGLRFEIFMRSPNGHYLCAFVGFDNLRNEIYQSHKLDSIKEMMDARYGQLQFKEIYKGN